MENCALSWITPVSEDGAFSFVKEIERPVFPESKSSLDIQITGKSLDAIKHLSSGRSVSLPVNKALVMAWQTELDFF